MRKHTLKCPGRVSLQQDLSKNLALIKNVNEHNHQADNIVENELEISKLSFRIKQMAWSPVYDGLKPSLVIESAIKDFIGLTVTRQFKTAIRLSVKNIRSQRKNSVSAKTLNPKDGDDKKLLNKKGNKKKM